MMLFLRVLLIRALAAISSGQAEPESVQVAIGRACLGLRLFAFLCRSLSWCTATRRAQWRLLALPILLLSALPAHAIDYIFPGTLPIGCNADTGSNYSCGALTLAAGDTITIAPPKPATITFNGALSIGAGVMINSAETTPRNLKMVIKGAFTLGAGATLNANLQTVGAGAVTVAAGSTVTGNISTENGDVTLGASAIVGGSVSTATGAVTVGGYAKVGSGVSTVTGYVTLGAYAKVGGPIATASAGYVVLGASAEVAGAITVSGGGYVSLGDSALVGGSISTVSDAITLGANSQVGGSLSVSQTGAVTLGANSSAAGNISAVNGAISIGSNGVVGGQISQNGIGAISIGAGGMVFSVCCPKKNASCVSDGSGVIPGPLMCVDVDYYELSVPAISLTCQPTAVTVTACANNTHPCRLFANTVTGTATLATTAGTISTAVLNAGVGTANLGYPFAEDGATATVSLAHADPQPVTPTICSGGSCSTIFSAAGFIFSAAAAGTPAIIPPQTSGLDSGIYYLRAVKRNTTTAACTAALTGSTTVNWAYQCNNPSSCSSSNLMSINGDTATTIQRNDNASALSYTAVPMTFDAGGNAPFTFGYSDAGQVKLWASKAVNSAPLLGASNAFVVKPHHFDLTSIQQTAAPNLLNPAAIDAVGAKFVKAGEPFSVTVTAKNYANGNTPNFGHEISPESVVLTSALVAGLGLTNQPAISGTFGAFSNGSAAADGLSFLSDGVTKSTPFTWDEVGIISLIPSLADGDYLGTGDITGPASRVGRFYVGQFALTAAAIANRTDIAGSTAGGCGTFTYMGEKMTALLTLTAQALDGSTTQNYTSANGFAKLNPTAAGNPLAFGAVDNAPTRTLLTARLDTSLTTTGNFVGGIASISAPLVITRSTAEDGPYAALDIGVAPQDSDGASMAAYNLDTTNLVSTSNDHTKLARTQVRFGRLRLQNAYGSEFLDLPVPLDAQYWAVGGNYVTNTDDSCTVIPMASITMGNYLGQLKACETQLSPLGNVTMVAGKLPGAGLLLSRPGAGNAGSVDLAINLSAIAAGNTCLGPAQSLAVPANMLWLGPSPGSRATFGVYKSKFIYLRENY